MMKIIKLTIVTGIALACALIPAILMIIASKDINVVSMFI